MVLKSSSSAAIFRSGFILVFNEVSDVIIAMTSAAWHKGMDLSKHVISNKNLDLGR